MARATTVAFDARGGGSPSTPASSGSSSSLDAWVRAHRLPILGVGGAAVAILALYRKSKGNVTTPAPASAPNSGAASGAGITSSAASQVPMGSYFDSSSSYDSLAQQIQNLQSQIGALGAQSPTVATTAVPPVPPHGPLSGSGFLPPGTTAADIPTNPGTYTAQDAAGDVYTWLNPAEAAAWTGPEYYEPLPADFEVITPSTNLLTNTPRYAKGGELFTPAAPPPIAAASTSPTAPTAPLPIGTLQPLIA
jgi:hypothetical protein